MYSFFQQPKPRDVLADIMVMALFTLAITLLGTAIWGVVVYAVWNVALAPWQGWREIPWLACVAVGFVVSMLLGAIRGRS